MAFSYLVDTDRGKVRLLITDTDSADPYFVDAEIDAFLSMQGSVVFLAAAQALEVMAVNELMILKAIRLLDLTTNGPAMAKALNDKAAALRKQVDGEAAFDWAEMSLDAFSYHELIYKEALRDG